MGRGPDCGPVGPGLSRTSQFNGRLRRHGSSCCGARFASLAVHCHLPGAGGQLAWARGAPPLPASPAHHGQQQAQQQHGTPAAAAATSQLGRRYGRWKLGANTSPQLRRRLLAIIGQPVAQGIKKVVGFGVGHGNCGWWWAARRVSSSRRARASCDLEVPSAMPSSSAISWCE